MHKLLAIVLAFTLAGFPPVHASVVQAHDASHHAHFGVEDLTAHHAGDQAGSQACDPVTAECEDENTYTACCPALSVHCSGATAATGFIELVHFSTHSLEASWLVSGAMAGRKIQPETPPPRS